MITKKYGVIYTPDSLSLFVAELLKRFISDDNKNNKVILDPASGECSLLRSAKSVFGDSCSYIGIDIDLEAVQNTKKEFNIIFNDAIVPSNVNVDAGEYWKKNLPLVDVIIANPPWSSEKVYDRASLANLGYTFAVGQYDSYVLFMELSYKLLRQGGIMAFILPDSLFDAQNEKLREFLAQNTCIMVIARLGEKIFDEVNRATTIIICKKEMPTVESETMCFRLSTEDRKSFLAGDNTLLSYFDKGFHTVRQQRFIQNTGFKYDVDTHSNEEQLLKKITNQTVNLEKTFIFGRGVEISKSGRIVYCPKCSRAQGYNNKQLSEGVKECSYCGEDIPVTINTVQNVITKEKNQDNALIFVGENIRRYEIFSECYIKLNIEGINYKNHELYTPPKLLIRKTGLGIYSALDYSGSLTSQTVYILKYSDLSNDTPLEYYLALLNSRVVYYYYLKVYGENEWKSHPYLTKQILFDLPIKPYVGSEIDLKIIRLATSLMQKYNYFMDIELEKLIMRKYGLSVEEEKLISDEMSRLPNLSAVNDMKMEI